MSLSFARVPTTVTTFPIYFDWWNYMEGDALIRSEKSTNLMRKFCINLTNNFIWWQTINFNNFELSTRFAGLEWHIIMLRDFHQPPGEMTFQFCVAGICLHCCECVEFWMWCVYFSTTRPSLQFEWEISMISGNA